MVRHRPIEEQVIAVTGASSGIGLCTALMASERGAKVVMISRSEAILQEMASAIRAEGGDALAIGADVSDRQEIDAAVEAIVQRFGRIDTWVNNAGVAIYGRLMEVSEQDSRRLFDVNFWGVVNGSLAALPHLARSGGALINIGSELSDAVVPLQGMYAASKHAVKGFTDALRVEIERLGQAPVSVVLIQPTAVDTPYPEHARNYMDREPKLPDPMLDPTRVANAVLKAAVEGGRDVTVGAMAAMNTTVSKLLPRLADRMAVLQGSRQQRDSAPRQREGALYQPSQDGRIHGSGAATDRG
jgi:NADP-dependent 3-hydroxy acid dehydrogenase YdfG